MRSCNDEVALAIIFALMDRSASKLRETLIQLLPLHLRLLYTHTQNINIYVCVYIYICQKKKKPNEHWTVKHNLQHLRFIEKGIWKASIQKKRKKKPKKK